MWNLSFAPPEVIDAKVLTRLPDGLRKPRRTDWVDANKPGSILDSFIEGPAFDHEGNLYITDIPYGRILRVSPSLDWTVVCEYDGWPNGIAIHRDGSLWIADYKRGLLRLEVGAMVPDVLLGHRNSESFKGLNDLTFDGQGRCYFTDQGQTGLHDSSGRVFRWTDQKHLELLLSNAPSPNGLVISVDQKTIFVAVTRANAVWRAPLLPDGSVSKMGAFQTFFGTSGPDGMAMDEVGRLIVAHASLCGAFVLSSRGEVTHFVRSPVGTTITNVAFRPGTSELVLTESHTGTVLTATLPGVGAALYSHA